MPIVKDIAAERSILSSLACHGQQALLDVQDILTIQSFTHESNQVVYKCLVKCIENGNTPDIPSLLSAANELNLYEVLMKDIDFVKAIFSVKVELGNTRKLAGKVKKLEIARELQSALKEAHHSLEEITGNESIDEILSLAENPIFDLSTELNSQNDQQPELIMEGALEYLDHLEQNQGKSVGISSGFPIYDKVIGNGFRRGYLATITARPKSGKSVWAKEIGLNVSKRNIPVLILDTEMDKFVQSHRIYAGLSNLTIDEIESGEFAKRNKQKVIKAVKDNQNIPLYYKRIAGKPFDEILSIIRRWVRKNVGTDENGLTNPCLIIYDYFKMMDSSDIGRNMQEYQALGYQISKLTDFLGEHQIAGLAFVQANRDGIEKDTTDIVSGSDRIVWLCASMCLLRKKSKQEIIEEGHQNGNTKLIPMDAMRFSEGLDEGDYINLQFDRPKSKMTELNTRSQALRNATAGFELDE